MLTVQVGQQSYLLFARMETIVDVFTNVGHRRCSIRMRGEVRSATGSTFVQVREMYARFVAAGFLLLDVHFARWKSLKTQEAIPTAISLAQSCPTLHVDQ